MPIVNTIYPMNPIQAMRYREPISTDQAQTSEAMADIALNSFGLILIVLLVYILIFQRMRNSSEPVTTSVEETVSTASESLRENQSLRREVEQLKQRLQQQALDGQTSGLWRFRTHVTALVDNRGRSEPADFEIDYFVWLEFAGDQVRGTLYGIKEHSNVPLNSGSHASIGGVQRQGTWSMSLQFAVINSTAEEIFVVEKIGDRFVGHLRAGKASSGQRLYTGPTIGTRLTESELGS